MAIDGFDDEIVEELRNRANDTLLTQALTGETSEVNEQAASLASLDGMTKTVLDSLLDMGINTVDALAELSVDELLGIKGLTEEKAGALIMKARASWF